MHCSIWTYRGDPDDLAARYQRMVAEIPADNMQFSACARTDDGIVIFDTCPSREVYEQVAASAGLRALLTRHGLEAPDSLSDFPVVAAYAGGRRVDG